MSLLDESLAISSELGMRPLTAYQGAIELTLTLIAWSSTKSRPAVCQLSIAESLIQIQKMWRLDGPMCHRYSARVFSVG